MNSKILLVVAFAAVQQISMGMNFAEPRLIPAPHEFKFAADRCTVLDSNTVLSVACPDARGGEWAARHFGEWFGAKPHLKATAGGAAIPDGDEAYALVADSAGVNIEARSLAGVRYAMYTLRQCAMAARGTAVTRAYVLPHVEVVDAPGPQNSIYICRRGQGGPRLGYPTAL